MQPVAGEAVLSDERGQRTGGSLVAALDIVARGRAAEDERAHLAIMSSQSRCALTQVKAERDRTDDLSLGRPLKKAGSCRINESNEINETNEVNVTPPESCVVGDR